MTAPGPSDPHARPQPDGSDVGKVTEADVPRVAEALGRAFDDDPVSTWMYPNPETRPSRLDRGFDLYLRRIWLRHDECYTTNRFAGAALWMPPDTWHMSPLRQLMMLPAMIRVSRGDTSRLLRLFAEMEKRHPKESHWYLPIIGIRPEWQGRGFGAALLRPVLERCDAEGVPAYLEASTPRSRALYERQGFEVSGDVITVKDSAPLWPMWREPRR